MLFRAAIILSLVLLTLFSLSCLAEIKYISLHDIESEPRQPLTLKLNIVERQPKPLHFTLVNQNVESRFIFKRMNNYMLKLKSPLRLIGEGAINVYELDNNAWILIKTIPLTYAESLEVNKNGLVNKVTDNLSNKLKVVETVKPADIVDIAKTNKLAKVSVENNCQLTRQYRETLWSIASRYRLDWKVDVFGAMIAIYKSNLKSFTNQHIGSLIQGSILSCPASKVLSSLGTKKAMRAEYTRLSTVVKKASGSSSDKLPDILPKKLIAKPVNILSAIAPIEQVNTAGATQFSQTAKAGKLNNCQFKVKPKETLWSIASRYQAKWRVDVFGAMVAIYKSNLKSFTNQHIGSLMKGSTLNCPSDEALLNLGDKEVMRTEYMRLSNLNK